MTKLDPMEKVIQIQAANHTNGIPFVIALTNNGRVLASSGVWSAKNDNWIEVELPEVKQTELDNF